MNFARKPQPSRLMQIPRNLEVLPDECGSEVVTAIIVPGSSIFQFIFTQSERVIAVLPT